MLRHQVAFILLFTSQFTVLNDYLCAMDTILRKQQKYSRIFFFQIHLAHVVPLCCILNNLGNTKFQSVYFYFWWTNNPLRITSSIQYCRGGQTTTRGQKNACQDIFKCPLNFIEKLNFFKSIDNSTYWIEKDMIMGAGITFVMVWWNYSY